MKRLLLCCVLAVTACTDRPDRPEAPAAGPEPAAQPAPQEVVDSIDVVFTRNEQPVTIRRAAAREAGLEEALRALLAGPTAEEQAAGIQSWFSASTSSALHSVTLDEEGSAIVDFTDLRQLIPNAASSAGSALLLQELNGTVFQFPQVRSVEYRIAGSCAAFWEWLQYDCQVVERPAR